MIDDKPADRALNDLYEQKIISESILRTDIMK